MGSARDVGRLGLLACLALAAGCGQAADDTTPTNPTGSCGIRSEPDGVTEVPDCDAPLPREFWRVYLQADGKTAYTLPRMDGEPYLQPACADATDDLHQLVVRYDLCAPAQNTEQVNVVNSMSLADALRLTHFLHQQLKFLVNGTAVTPQPSIYDVFDACALHTNSPDLQTMCDSAHAAFDKDLGSAYSQGPAAAELADRLNELYGISTN